MLIDAYIGIGSNLGQREINLCEAVHRLKRVSLRLRVSSIYETMPIGFSTQPAFLNAACEIWTTLSPFELLESLRRIEAELGRQRPFANAPRILDLDILIYGRMVVDSPLLTIPHPRMVQREFVLAPLEDLAPDLVHPVLKETTRSLLARLPRTGVGLSRHFQPE